MSNKKTFASSFSLPSARRLYKYLGEMDAMVELTELAVRSFLHSAKQSDDVSAFVRSLSEKHCIRVNYSAVDCLSLHLARSYIVTVYQSSERFMHEFRKEHQVLYQRKWTGDSMEDDPLTVALKNIASNKEAAGKSIGWDLITRFQYYRTVRNWIIHTKDSNLKKPLDAFEDIKDYSSEHQALFNQVNAPNQPEELTFDDFVLFSRLTKCIAEKMCQIVRPSDDYWKESLLSKFKQLRNNPDRMKNAVAGLLRTDYGIDEVTAKRIVSRLVTH